MEQGSRRSWKILADKSKTMHLHYDPTATCQDSVGVKSRKIKNHQSEEFRDAQEVILVDTFGESHL